MAVRWWHWLFGHRWVMTAYEQEWKFECSCGTVRTFDEIWKGAKELPYDN